MALSVGTPVIIETQVAPGSPGNASTGSGYVTYRRITVTGDSSYPAGGYPITPAMFGFTIGGGQIESENASPWSGQIDRANPPRLHLFPRGPGHTNNFGLADEIAAGTNVTAYSCVLGGSGY